MKRCLLLVLLATLVPQLWAASSIITTNGTTCVPATNCLVYNMPQDDGGATLTVSGTWTGTISFEATGDGGTTWVAVNVMPLNSTTAVTSTTANGTWQVNTAGFTGLRMRGSATMTGSALATINPSAASARNGGSSGGGGGSPGGSNTQVQFNNNGAFGGITGATSDGTNLAVTTQSANDNSTKAASTAYVDRAASSVAWDAITNPAGNMALSMGTNTSIFSGTAATSQFFAWKNTTAAVVGTSQGSPILANCGRGFHGSPT